MSAVLHSTYVCWLILQTCLLFDKVDVFRKAKSRHLFGRTQTICWLRQAANMFAALCTVGCVSHHGWPFWATIAVVDHRLHRHHHHHHYHHHHHHHPHHHGHCGHRRCRRYHCCPAYISGGSRTRGCLGSESMFSEGSARGMARLVWFLESSWGDMGVVGGLRAGSGF